MPTLLAGDTGASHGVVLGLLNLDIAWHIEIERAPDSSGSPDTSNSEIIDTVPGYTRKYIDERNAGSGPWHYRWRTSLDGCSAGPWSDWFAANPRPIPSTIPDLPNVPPVIVARWEADQIDDTTGEVTLEVIDFEQRVTALEFNDKPGANSVFQGWKSSWDTSTGTKSSDLTLTRTEQFTLHEKHNTIVKGRVKWDAPEGGTREEVLPPYTMDIDRTPELYDAMMRVGSGDGSVFVSARGDGDVSHIYGRFSESSTPSDPDGSETDGTAGEVSVGQQTLSDYDTGLDVSKGSTVHGKLRGENSNGTLGPVVELHLDRFDFDDEAEVNTLSGAIDEPDGSVLVSAGGDDDVDTIYVTVDEGSDPAAPDGTEDNITAGEGRISTRSGTVDTDLQIDENSTAHIKARGENTDGTLGPVKEARVERPPADVVTWELEADQSGSTGTATLRVQDPETRVTDLEFQEKTDASGFGAWSSAWDSSTGFTGSDTSLTRSEDIPLTEKHNVAIKVRITYTDRNGDARELIPSSVAFDVDNIAEINSVGSSIDDSDGTLVASAGGDDDVKNIYVTVGEGSDPSDPTAGSHDGQISGRSGATDTGVTISEGATAHVKYVGENSNGDLGPVKLDRVTRAATNPSQVLEVDGSEDRGAGTWTINLEVLGSDNYDIEIQSAGGDASYGLEDSYISLTGGDTRSESGNLFAKVNTRVRIDAWPASDTHSDSNLVHRETLVFDPDKVPDIVNMDATVNSSSQIEASIKGDTDTESVEIEYDFTGDGTVDETFTDSGTSGSDTSSGTVAQGDTAIVTMHAYPQTGQSGTPTSDTVKVTRSPKGPALEIVSVFAADDGTDIDYQVDYTPTSPVTDADYTAEANFYAPDGSFAASATETSPVTNQSITATDTGAGDGSSGPGDQHTVQLVLKESGSTVDSKSGFALETF